MFAPPATTGNVRRPLRATCLVKRWDHHTASGGYDRQATAVGARAIARAAWVNGTAIDSAWLLYVTRRHKYLLDYRLGDFIAESWALAGNLLRPPDIMHVLYGDEQLDMLLRYRALLRCPLVVSFHLPYSRSFERFERHQKHLMHKIDAAVVMCQSEIEPIERAIGKGKVVSIRHGIDTDIFSPGEPPSAERLQLAFVGDHMRDWDVLHRVIDEVNNRDLPVDFTIVTKDNCFPYFTGCRNTTLLAGISEADLVDVYRRADAGIVPVVDATANNAVLESLACGAPVISTDVNGIPDYVGDAGWLFPRGEAAPIVELIARMSADRSIAAERRAAARRQALTMDWREAGRQMLAIYDGLLNGIRPADALKAALDR